MLEGLLNRDFSGISGKISIVYDNANQYISEIILALGFVFVAIAFTIFFIHIYRRIIDGRFCRKTEQYRKVLSDMYVVGMIKKFANEDEINILDELKEFNQIEKKRSFRIKGIDDAIEEHLSEKIAEKGFDKIDKLKKEDKE